MRSDADILKELMEFCRSIQNLDFSGDMEGLRKKIVN